MIHIFNRGTNYLPCITSNKSRTFLYILKQNSCIYVISHTIRMYPTILDKYPPSLGKFFHVHT